MLMKTRIRLFSVATVPLMLCFSPLQTNAYEAVSYYPTHGVVPLTLPLPGQVIQSLPGQRAHMLPGQTVQPLPGQIVRALPGQIVPPLPGQILLSHPRYLKPR